MPEYPIPPQHIVTNDLWCLAHITIDTVQNNVHDGFLLDAKLGDDSNKPMSNSRVSLTYDVPFNTIRKRFASVVEELVRSDQENGNPLRRIAERANDVISRAAIINPHYRRPTLYSESAIEAFISLGIATPQHSAVIRAAGYVLPPPDIPRSRGIDFFIADIAAHMARSHGRQSPVQILESVRPRRDPLANWPRLDLTLFICRVANILPDEDGYYHSHQPWSNHISTKRLVANTMLHIFDREQKPCTTEYLATETDRLVGHLLPKEYNTFAAIRFAAYEASEVSWQGPSTFGLRDWDTAIEPQNMAARRGRTGDLVYTFLIQNGPATVEDVIEHVQQVSTAKRRTVLHAINHDPADRFVRVGDRLITVNPIPKTYNSGAPGLQVVPDHHYLQPAPALTETEFLWIESYVRALNDLVPPFPVRVAITGPRAAGIIQPNTVMEITAVIDARYRSDVEPSVAEIVAITSRQISTVQPNIKILSPRQWNRQQNNGIGGPHYNIWLPPNFGS